MAWQMHPFCSAETEENSSVCKQEIARFLNKYQGPDLAENGFLFIRFSCEARDESTVI